jgi:hypothetical protein
VGVEKPIDRQAVLFALVLNDADKGERMGRHGCRSRWLNGIEMGINPEGFGDVTLVD